MKKNQKILIHLLIVGSILVISFLIISKNRRVNINNNPIQDYEFNTIKYNNAIKLKKLSLLVFSTNYCSSCDFAFDKIKKFKGITIIKLPRNAYNNMLLGESLDVQGFPTSFLILDKNNIVGKIEGAFHLEQKLDSLLHKNNENIDSVSNIKILEKYLNGNYNEVKKLINQKVKNSMTVFDLYRIYKVHKSFQDKDTTIYKKLILNRRTNANFHIYNHIYTEIIN